MLVPCKGMVPYVRQIILIIVVHVTKQAIPRQVLDLHIKQDIVTSMYNKDLAHYSKPIIVLLLTSLAKYNISITIEFELKYRIFLNSIILPNTMKRFNNIQ